VERASAPTTLGSDASAPRAVRVWVDLTNSPHVLVLRPVIAALRARGADVHVTARDFAQTVGLAERFGLGAQVIGRHRGGRLAAKAVGLASRATALAGWAHRVQRRRGRFDLALGHGSNDVTVAAAVLRIPRSTMFDYEWATVQHAVNCRLADAIVVPDAIPIERLERLGAAGKVQPFPGLKEEYYLADFEPDAAVLDELGLDAGAPIAVVRTPPAVSLYHRFDNPLFAGVLERLRDHGQVVVLPRTAEQRAELRRSGGFCVPERAIDAQSLIAFADLVVSAGGTMNREAVALGTPVWTTFEGRLGAVDARLIAEGRLRKLERAEDLALVKRDGPDGDRARRDPALLVDLLCAPLAG
jgi:predicted glycosyltransferase